MSQTTASRPGGTMQPARDGSRDGAAPPAAASARHRAGLPRPGDRLPARLLRLPALPQPRPEPAALHPGLVRHRRRPVRRARTTTRRSSASPTFWPAVRAHRVFTVVSLVFQFAIGLALAVFFLQHFPLSATLRALFLVPWLLPLIVSASTWSWMLNSDSGVVNAVLGRLRHRPGQLAHLAALVADLGDHRQHLDRHPVQPGDPLQRPAEHPRRTSTRPPPSTARTPGSRSGASPSRCCARSRRSRCCSGCLHAEGLRHHLDHDARAARRLVHDLRHLVLPARLRQRRLGRLEYPRRGRRQPADRHRAGLRPGLHPVQRRQED